MPSARPGPRRYPSRPVPATAEELFAGHPRTLEVFRAVAAAVAGLESTAHEPTGCGSTAPGDTAQGDTVRVDPAQADTTHTGAGVRGVRPRGVRVRVGRSQISFARRRGFAYVWRPGQYVRSGVPAVLSLALAERVDSPRVKEVAHPSQGVFMHHVEMSGPGDLDDEVLALLEAAYDSG